VTQQTADDTEAPLLGTDRKDVGCQKIYDDVVVVPCVKRDRTLGFTYGPNHIECLVTIERRNLDGDHIFDLHEFAPKSGRQQAAANGRLQVEPYDRNLFRNSAAMAKQGCIARTGQSGQAQQAGVIT
jgi:hypothetical protein